MMPLGDLSVAKARQEELRREAAKHATGALLTGSLGTRWRSRIGALSFCMQVVGFPRKRPLRARLAREVPSAISGDLSSGQ
jgi:hypothetical protein